VGKTKPGGFEGFGFPLPADGNWRFAIKKDASIMVAL
jgi:hypothetical protein